MLPPLVYHSDYFCDIGSHVFPVQKYRLVYEGLKEAIPDLDSLLHAPEQATREQLRRVHTPEYLADLDSHQYTERTLPSELPISAEIVRAYYLMAGGSILAAELALEHGAAMNIGGGFHHAFADHAEGFCYVNDVAMAVRHVLAEPRRYPQVARVAVVDVDLHQGNGTARILDCEPDVYTFSIHQENNYPEKEQSDLDIGLPDGLSDARYLDQLRSGLKRVFEGFGPDLVVYVAGVDPYEDDQLGGLRLSLEGIRQRDALVFEHCRQRGAAVAVVLAGGYAFSVERTVEMHVNAYLAMRDASVNLE